MAGRTATRAAPSNSRVPGPGRRPKIYHPIVGILACVVGFLVASFFGAVVFGGAWLAFRAFLADARPTTLALRVGMWVVPAFTLFFIGPDLDPFADRAPATSAHAINDAVMRVLEVDEASVGCRVGASFATVSLTHDEAIETLDLYRTELLFGGGWVESGHQLSQEATMDGASSIVQRIAIVAQADADNGMGVAVVTAELFPPESMGTPGAQRAQQARLAEGSDGLTRSGTVMESVVTTHMFSGCQRKASVASWADMVRGASESRWNLVQTPLPRRPSQMLD